MTTKKIFLVIILFTVKTVSFCQEKTSYYVNKDDGLYNDYNSTPLWTWFVFIGIALAVSGGVAVFVVKRK
jgi:hypothetical protein